MAEDMMLWVREKGEQRPKSSVETRNRIGRPQALPPAVWQDLQFLRDYNLVEKLLKKFSQVPYFRKPKQNQQNRKYLLNIKTF